MSESFMMVSYLYYNLLPFLIRETLPRSLDTGAALDPLLDRRQFLILAHKTFGILCVLSVSVSSAGFLSALKHDPRPAFCMVVLLVTP